MDESSQSLEEFLQMPEHKTKVFGTQRTSDAQERPAIENLNLRASALKSIPVVAALVAGFDVSLIIFMSECDAREFRGWCEAIVVLTTTSLLAAIGIIMETSMRGFYWTRIAVHNTDAADKYLSETSWHYIRSLMMGYTLSATLSAGFCVALPGLSFTAMTITLCLILIISIPIVIVLRKLFWKGEQWIAHIRLQLRSCENDAGGTKSAEVKFNLKFGYVEVNFEDGITYTLNGWHRGVKF